MIFPSSVQAQTETLLITYDRTWYEPGDPITVTFDQQHEIRCSYTGGTIPV